MRTEAVSPDTDLTALGKVYQDMAVSGVCTPEQRATLIDEGRRIVHEPGAEAVVLAGTDLNLAFDGGAQPGYPVMNALDVHVGVLVDLALDRRTLPVTP